MLVNCNAEMLVGDKKIDNVNEFKYLGIMMSNNTTKPDQIIKARLNAAKRSFISICTNCKLIGITNVRVKLLLVNALVRSVLLYGCILYACMSDV